MTISFIDDAASRIAKTLLAALFTMNGPLFSFQKIIQNAYYFAQKLDENKTDNEEINEFALRIVEGMLFGFYENSPENKNWSGMVHTQKIPLFVRDAYRIAEMIIAKSQEIRDQATVDAAAVSDTD
jgi:hypothetical protein